MKQAFIVSLEWDINFNDADEGDCYAGSGEKILKVFTTKDKAAAFVDELNPILRGAEGESTIFPVQKSNRLLKEKIGLTVHDIDDSYNFRAVFSVHDVED